MIHCCSNSLKILTFLSELLCVYTAVSLIYQPLSSLPPLPPASSPPCPPNLSSLGVLTSVLCLLLLVSYHASRDALITVLPSISACVNATLPPLEPQASYSHPLMAVQTRARSGSATANLRDELYRYLRDTRGYEELEMDYPQKLRLERDVQAEASYLQNLMVEKEVENDSENKGYVGMFGSVISTTERNLVDYQDLRIAERGILGEKTKENRNYSADNVKIIEYIRKSLSGKGYNLHTSVVRELLNLQDELNAFRPFRDDLNDSLVSTNFSSEALNSTKISNLGSFSIPNTEFESSDVDGSGGRQFVVKTGIDADGSGGSQIVVEKAEVDGSGSGGTVDGGTIDRSAITKVNQAHFVSEEQLQKLMRLLDYIDVGHEKKMNPVFRAQDNVEEEPLVCEYYDFRGLMFMSNWPLAVQGSVLAGVHLTSIIGMFVGHYCVEGR
ncbi:hypothetical protein FHG87_020329 [Trinorchestia longiramus]|nr:hypothetical protein FHG87_020329 [Trinorchestia longiramus]